ncbi:pyridoxamine 5'-phosphate oxidase family protein [Cryobacterium glaciale]|uniref:Pyridoxamine 5'-phosphate oxidase family protein n=1 Tax=Cryobacterium glaciale TaxID=1259145 RepID=A0A4R8UZZ2_9MICO|nr:pyridoxamine 5'-phosphate oxidase family protein [Cryobacterium glaciale]TFB75460.1 pyridoxamine 5'-phosphate oxidase family protein [Cryobacterium glaciale]
MATWQEVVQDAPQFAARVRERFDAGTNKTMASLRRDGSPRISGTELVFEPESGRVTLGMMPNSLKLHDVLRDPRVAIHSPTLEPPAGQPSDWAGDAKLAGVLVAIAPNPADPPGSSSFEVRVHEVVLTYIDPDNTHLIIESWHEGRGWKKISRL